MTITTGPFSKTKLDYYGDPVTAPGELVRKYGGVFILMAFGYCMQ